MALDFFYLIVGFGEKSIELTNTKALTLELKSKLCQFNYWSKWDDPILKHP